MEIRFIKRADIDRLKWDSCVHYANNGHVFGYTWYLDNTAEDWDGLVEGNYESVLPLIWKDAPDGTKYLTLPHLVPAAGIYSVHVLSEVRVAAFKNAIPPTFNLGTLRFLPGTRISGWSDTTRSVSGYRLYVNETYEVLSAAYSSELTAKLDSASNKGLRPRHTPPKPEEVAAFFRKHHPRGNKDTASFHAMQRIMYNALHRGIGFSSAIVDGQGHALAMDFFLFSHGKLLSLTPVSTRNGRKLGALEMLFDLMIQTQAGRPLILDFNLFENAEFPMSFGAHHVAHHEAGPGLPGKKPSGWWPWKRSEA